MKHSLRTRLILSFLGVIVATVALVVVLANRITSERFNYLISSTGQMKAQRLAPLFEEYYAEVGSWEGVEALVDAGSELRPQPMMGNGHGWRGGNGPMMSAMLITSDDRLILADAGGWVIADSGVGEREFRLAASDLDKGSPIVVDGRQVGTLVVASGLGALTSNQSAFLRQVSWLMLGAGVVAGLAVLLVGSFQAQRIVAPVRALAEAAHRVAGGDLSQRVPVTSQDELGEMAAAFNSMAAQLERQHTLRRRAMADIAHELRTPLSILQIDLESIEDGLTAPTPDVLARLQEEVALLNRLVEDLRMLSLADAGELHLDRQPVDMAGLVQAAAAGVGPAAREKGVKLSTEAADNLAPVLGDQQRLAQVLLNLLSNALRHTPAGGSIVLSVQPRGKQEVQVQVQDTGEGIPAGDLPHVFERFYRAPVTSTDGAPWMSSPVRGGEGARSEGRSGLERSIAPETGAGSNGGSGPDRRGGSGLGLSIARSLVQAHGGQIWAESVEGQGSTFAFTLPVADGRAHG